MNAFFSKIIKNVLNVRYIYAAVYYYYEKQHVPEGGWLQQGHVARRLPTMPRLTWKVSSSEGTLPNLPMDMAMASHGCLLMTKQEISKMEVLLKCGCLPLSLLVSSRPTHANCRCPTSCACCMRLGSRTLNDDDNGQIYGYYWQD